MGNAKDKKRSPLEGFQAFRRFLSDNSTVRIKALGSLEAVALVRATEF
jgi:hypothetical protein